MEGKHIPSLSFHREGMKTGGKVGGWDGWRYRYALLLLNWSLHTSHKTWLAPYTSCLHVKAPHHCWGLTAHLTCLEWKKGGIFSCPSLPSAFLSGLNKPISWTFQPKRTSLKTRVKLGIISFTDVSSWAKKKGPAFFICSSEQIYLK